MRPPSKSWRKPGVKGIYAYGPKADPCFDIDGLPNPFSVFFPCSITNLYGVTIYITAQLISPPAGWSDAEQNVTTLSTGASTRVEKSNATRSTPAGGSNETVTCRWRYKTGSYAGTVVGQDDFVVTIYWESVAAGVIDDTDDFEDPIDPGPPETFDGWQKTNLYLTVTWSRVGTAYVHGAYSCFLVPSAQYAECQLFKTVSIAAGSRAAIFGYLRKTNAAYSRTTISGPIEDLEIVYCVAAAWRRWGVRLNPGASNTVNIYDRWHWGQDNHWIDYIRWVHWV